MLEIQLLLPRDVRKFLRDRRNRVNQVVAIGLVNLDRSGRKTTQLNFDREGDIHSGRVYGLNILIAIWILN